MEADKTLTPAARVRKRYEDTVGVFQPYWEAITREENFLAGERYERDHGPERTDRRLTQIRGQEIQDTVRNFAAQATARPRSVEGRPVDHDTDPDAAELEVALVDQELKNPWKGFETRYYECVLDSREKRMGVLWMDWEPDHGPYGEIFYRTIDPRRCMWEPGYDPHHPLCGWFLEKRRCDVEWVHRSFKGSDWVKEDGANFDLSGRRLSDDVPLIQMGDGHTLAPQATVRDGKAELWFCWYKNDGTAKYRETGNELNLEPEDRYLSCANGCGYRSPTQGELLEQGKIETELPEELDGCPDCEMQGQSGMLQRIDRFAENEQVRAYSRGKRLVIIAPFSAAPDDKAVYDGAWPIKTARSFPALFLWSYLAPRKPMGKSDVTLMWDQQVAADNLDTIALQRVFEHRNYWVLPAAGVTDYRGKRFEFRDDQFNVMYRDASKQQFGDLGVESVNATGVDQAWASVRESIQQRLTQYRGITDFGLTPDSSKDIAVGTVERLTQQQNIGIEEYNRRKNQELSKFYGVVSDYIHATYTPQRLTRLNIDGIDLLVNMWGQDLPNFDFVVEETPEFTGLDKAKQDAFNALVQIPAMAMQVGIPADRLMEVFADVTSLPRSVVRKLQKELEAAAQAGPPGGGLLDAGMGAEGMPAAPGMPGMEGMMGEMNGLNAPDMVSGVEA